jgi:hypothetical protein
MDGSPWLNHPLHGKLCFFDQKEFACCTDGLEGDWKYRDRIEITMTAEKREGATEITVMNMLNISTAAENMLELLTDTTDAYDACERLWEWYRDGIDVGSVDEDQFDEDNPEQDDACEYTPGSFWYTVEKLS